MMNRYKVKSMAVRIVDTESNREFEFSECQWNTAQLLARCYAKYADRVAGIKFLSNQFENQLNIEIARVLYDAAVEHIVNN